MKAPRVLPLDDVRADGWFQRLRESSPDVERVIEVVGELTLAFSTLLGVQIVSLRVDDVDLDASVVEVAVGEDAQSVRLALGDLRERVVEALAQLPLPNAPVPVDESEEALSAFIGTQALLLAPLLGVTLLALVLDPAEPPRVRVRVGSTEEELTRPVLYSILRKRVAAEGKAAERPPFSIDLGTIPKADAAEKRGDHGEVVRLLAPWAGPLSVLLRTGEGQALSPEVRASLGHALGMLGTAQAISGQQAESAEDVLRLGIQWAQGGAGAPALFRRLGEQLARTGRGAEALGPLRRASALGESPRLILPTLAASYADAGKMVAAAACLDEALSVGCPESALAPTRARVEAVLGEAWARFREACPRSSPDEGTIPPSA